MMKERKTGLVGYDEDRESLRRMSCEMNVGSRKSWLEHTCDGGKVWQKRSRWKEEVRTQSIVQRSVLVTKSDG